MKLSPRHRAATAWMLYLCILSNLLACAIAHGQYAGLELSGIGGLYCSAAGNSGQGFAEDLGGSDNAGLSTPYTCAMGSNALDSLGLLFVLAWLQRPARTPRAPREQGAKAPPRHCWPSANPRASPSF